MISMSELKEIVPHAKARFIDRMSSHADVSDLLTDTPLTICNRSNAKAKHNAALIRCHSVDSGFSPDTCGEVIHGAAGDEVLLYQYRFSHPMDFERTLWHEWGHLLSNQYIEEINAERLAYFKKREASHDRYYHENLPADEREYQERLAFGTQLWCEFISDTICNIVADDEPQDIAWHIQDHMKEMLLIAVSNIPVQIELLAHYCSMVLTNATVVAHCEADDRFSIGLEFVPAEVAKLVDRLLCLLADQLNEEQICCISKERIMEIGALINEIWAAIEDNNVARVMAFNERLSGLQR